MGQLTFMPNVLTPTKSKNKKVFGKYTNAIYNNLSKMYCMDDSFFLFAPRPLLPYYWNVIRPNLQWYRGYFPGIHNQGIYTTCKAHAICQKVANMTYSGGFRFEGEDQVCVDFLNDFVRKDRTAWKLKRALPMNNATGMTLVHLDVNLDGTRAIRFTDGNRYFVEVDQDGKVLAFRRLVMVLTPGVGVNQDITSATTGYYLVQDRWVADGSCYETLKLYKAPAVANGTTIVTNEPIDASNYPLNVHRELLAASVDVNRIGKTYKMPMNEIAARVILCNDAANGFEDYQYLSDPLLNDCHTYLREYDECYTDKNMDRILAAKGVILPKYMAPGDVGANASAPVQALNYMAFKESSDTLDGHIYEKTNSFNYERDEPFFYMSDLRAATYDADLDGITKKIADHIFISSSDLGVMNTSDVGSGDRTAYEVATVTGISKTTIDGKREKITEAMEYVFRCLLRLEFKNEDAKCSMVFNSDKAANPTQELDDIIKQLEKGLIDRETAIKKLNPNYSEEEVNQMILKIQGEEQQKMQQEMQNYGNIDKYQFGNDGNIVNDDLTDPNKQFVNENPIT